mmetsp:Transcript_10432/g.21200  ORF Transcript_10432/g.21200 Transcript_10432/m.21200 type:complete len:275 (+) Transcript_10432:243-1067(+)|eukprot:scaffold15108_cov180-Amphora_coffeaeformis.AAC.43
MTSPRRTRSGRVFHAGVPPARLEEEEPQVVVPAAATPVLRHYRGEMRPPTPPVDRGRQVSTAAVDDDDDDDEQQQQQQENNNRGSPQLIASFGPWFIRASIENDNLFRLSFRDFGPENPARVFVLHNAAFANFQAVSATAGVHFDEALTFPTHPNVHFHGTAFGNVTNTRPPPRPPALITPPVKCPSLGELMHDSLAVPSDSAHGDSSTSTPTCIICWDNCPIVIAYPCNHVSYCVACARTLSLTADGHPKRYGQVTCPKCRTAVQSFERCVFE